MQTNEPEIGSFSYFWGILYWGILYFWGILKEKKTVCCHTFGAQIWKKNRKKKSPHCQNLTLTPLAPHTKSTNFFIKFVFKFSKKSWFRIPATYIKTMVCLGGLVDGGILPSFNDLTDNLFLFYLRVGKSKDSSPTWSSRLKGDEIIRLF